ncbi:MAG: hypothetical protein FWH47_07990 [Methanomassiliicoccaceae archaeon]|nr:hypothetical protein [Methanomassiliicoccaceae archaeon]
MTEYSSTRRDIKHIESIIGHCDSIADAVEVFGSDEGDSLYALRCLDDASVMPVLPGQSVEKYSIIV